MSCLIFIGVGLGVSLVYFLLVQRIPVQMNYATIIVGGLALLGTGVTLFFYRTDQTWLIIPVAIFVILVLMLIVTTIACNRDSWQMHSKFLKYSASAIRLKPSTLLYIPIFFTLLLLFLALTGLEFKNIRSYGERTFDPSTQLYWHQELGFFPVLLLILLSIQTIWGFQFIK